MMILFEPISVWSIKAWMHFSFLAGSDPDQLNHISPCHILPCHISPCLAMSYLTMSYFTMSYITLSYHVISYHVPYHVLPCHIMPYLTYHVLPSHIVHTMSRRVIFTRLKWELENNLRSAIHFHVLNRQLIQLLRHKRKKVSLKEMRALGFFLPPSLEQCWVFKPWNVQRVCKLWKCPILWNVYQKLVGKDSLYHCQACT